MLKLAAFLSLIWALTLLYGEMFSFWLPFLSCSWPPPPPSMTDGVDHQRDYVKIAVLTDPQLMDRTSLRLAPKSLALEAAQFYTDLYMRRAFLSSILPSEPDVILFLGDYFDGGPFLSDEEWQESWSRFKHIFDIDMLEQTTNIKLYYLAGNHDIGYAAFHSHIPEVIKRYEKAFGARNYQFTAGKVDFIAIDAQTLDGDPLNNVTLATWNFVKNVSKHSSSNSRVLLTHIPLYRPDSTACGPYRASSIINQRINRAAQDNEILYQNFITENGTNDLLDAIKPALILSGHDHDQCTVIHKSKYGSVKEHTLGTISWQQGNLFPSYMLLSASNRILPDGSIPEEAISTKVCFLPVQTYIYIWYLFLFVLTLLIAVFWPTNGVLFQHYLGGFLKNMRSLISSSFSGGGEKLKSEDETYEYEEIWDAEGSMHLIKKTFKVSSTCASESTSVERPYKTAKAMWDYLQRVYKQDNSARLYHLEYEIANYSQEDLSVQDYFSGFQNLWDEFTDIVYAKTPAESLSVVQQVHEQSKRDQFLMKLRSEFETVCSHLMNCDPSPSLDVCLRELLQEE